MRLARFNVEQAGRKKTYFHGLPSPAAGLTLATYYWFSQTELYSQTVILFTDDKTLADLPWQRIMGFLMAILAALMISDVPYAAFPSIGYRTTRQRIGSIVVAASLFGLIYFQKEFIFPALMVYVAYGILRWAITGLVGRAASPDELYWDGGSNGAPVDHRPGALANTVTDEDDDTADRERSQRRRKRRRNRGPRPGPPFPPEPPRDTTP
jgi:CDP-diacylglycerol--serine O-phosphatidyltransferase